MICLSSLATAVIQITRTCTGKVTYVFLLALLHFLPPPKVRDRVTVKCSLMLTITLTQTLGGYERAIMAFCLESNYQLVPWLRKFEKAYQFIVYLYMLRIPGLMKLSVAAVNSISLQSSITKTPYAHFISLRGSLFLCMLN